MFDEKSEKWIRIYKKITSALFWILIAIGLIAGLGDYTNSFLDFDLGDDTFLDLIIWALLGGGIAFIQLVVNMLVIQLFNNIQIIREKIEKM